MESGELGWGVEVVGALQHYGVAGAEGVAWDRLRPAVEGHIVERGHEERLVDEVGALVAQRRREDVHAARTRGGDAEQAAAVGEGDDGGEGRERCGDTLVVGVDERELHLVAGGAEDAAVEAVAVVDGFGAHGVGGPAAKRDAYAGELHAGLAGLGNEEQGAAVVDPCRQLLCLAGGQVVDLVEDYEADVGEC